MMMNGSAESVASTKSNFCLLKWYVDIGLGFRMRGRNNGSMALLFRSPCLLTRLKILSP